jgi:hypothetical protein
MPRWLQGMSIVIGVSLLLGAPLAWGWSRPAASVGEVPTITVVEDTAPEVVAIPEPDRDLVPEPRPAPPPPEPEAIADPVGLRIDALGVDAPVIPVGLEPDGGMEIPEDVQDIGWYSPGVRPGEKGSAVLSGHVDSYQQGPGAFFELRRLAVDDLVTLTHEDGTERTWRVVAREQYGKDQLPIDQLFVWGGDREQLVLITCGGEFDRTARSYADNIVVYTVPA